MAFQKYTKLNSKKIKEIFAKNLNPHAHDVLKAYIKKCYPTTNDEELHQTYHAACKFARGHSCIKPEHNAQKKVLAWPNDKKELFCQLYESGLSNKEIASHKTFSDDIKSHGTARHAIAHFAETLRCDTKKRGKGMQNEKERKVRPLNEQEEAILAQVFKKNRFLTQESAKEFGLESSNFAGLIKKMESVELCELIPGVDPLSYLIVGSPYNVADVFAAVPASIREKIDAFVLKTLQSKKREVHVWTSLQDAVIRKFKLHKTTFRYYLSFLMERHILNEGPPNVFSLAPAVVDAYQKFPSFRSFNKQALNHFDTTFKNAERVVKEDLVSIKESGSENFANRSLEELASLTKSDLDKKISPAIKFDQPQRILFLNLPLIGHHATNLEFLTETAKRILARPVEKRPTLLVLHGAFLGSFLHKEIKRKRTREGQLAKMGAQINWMHRFLELLGLPYIYIIGSKEDQLIVEHYAMQATIEEAGHMRGFSSEVLHNIAQQNDVMRLESYERNERDQQMIVYPYVLRTMRNPRNAEEMSSEYDIWDAERDLLVRAAKDKQRGRELDDDCNKVIDEQLLQNTPDRQVVETLRLTYPRMFLKAVSYVALSNAAAYDEPIKQLRSQIQKMQADYQPKDVPDIFVTGNDGVGGWVFVPPPVFPSEVNNDRTGTLGITLPGCQDERKVQNLGVYHGRVPQDRIAKAVIKRAVRPAVKEVWGTRDHIFIGIDNLKFQSVRTATAPEDVQRQTIALWHDVQLGLDQARFDLALKYLDYTLYHLRAQILLNLGDLGNFVNYLAALTHNTESNLPGVDLPLEVLNYVFKRVLLKEFSPNLEKVRWTSGNHEWNTPPRSQHLDLQHLKILYNVGKEVRPEIDHRFCKKIELKGRRGIKVTMSAPMGSDVICGLRLAYAHLWSGRFRQGAIPTQEQESWALAHGAEGIDMMVAGHQSSSYGKLHGDRLHLVFAGFEEVTDFTLNMHQAQNVSAGVIHLSTASSEPPVIELLTREFLENYKCQSPLFKDRNINDFIKEACDYAKRISSVE